MTYFRMAALGVAVSGLALLAGQGAAQTPVNPRLAVRLAVAPPKLEGIRGANRDCTAGELIFAESGGYAGSADVFDGPTALILQGTKLGDLSGITVVLSDGRRLAPLTRGDCPVAGGKSAVRVTFALPAAGSNSGARLELSAPRPPALVKAPPPAGPTNSCIDRLTGRPKACPEPPQPSSDPRLLTIASIVLNLKPRPALTGVSPDRIDGPGRDCRGRVVFSGVNLTRARVGTSTAANLNPVINITARSSTSITANIGRRCEVASVIDPAYFATMAARRGPAAETRMVDRCDTCSDVANISLFGGVTVKFVGTSQ